MNEKEKGCVYFFRHVGLKPIKIGYSYNPSPIKRFNQFKTYAPFGAEIIGFIQTDEAKKIETLLHQKYANKRLDGEWFLIEEADCLHDIDFFTAKEDIKERNDFQIEWAKKLYKNEEIKLEVDFLNKSNVEKFNKFKKMYNENPRINKQKTALHFNVARKTIYIWIFKIKNKKYLK